MATTAKQAMCLTKRENLFLQAVDKNHHPDEKVYSPGFGTELVTDWGTF